MNNNEIKEKSSGADPNKEPAQPAALTAKYCPICGTKLDENGACPSKGCPAYGAKVVAGGEAKAVGLVIEGKNCPVCGQFMDAAGKCTNINCVAVASGRKTGALSNEVADLKAKVEALRLEVDRKAAEVKILNASVVEFSTENMRLKSAAYAVPSEGVKVAELSSHLAEAKREIARLTPFESQAGSLKEKFEKATKELEEARTKNVNYTSEISSLEKKCGQYTAQSASLEKNLSEVHESHSNALQLVANKEAEKEALRADWNDEKARRDLAEQRLQNKIVENTKLQSENVELLLNKADNIRLNADLSGKLAETVKAKIALETNIEILKTQYSNEIAKLTKNLETEKETLRSEIAKRDSILTEKTKAIEKALLENKRVYKILNEAGLIVVDNAGNIVSH